MKCLQSKYIRWIIKVNILLALILQRVDRPYNIIGIVFRTMIVFWYMRIRNNIQLSKFTAQLSFDVLICWFFFKRTNKYIKQGYIRQRNSRISKMYSQVSSCIIVLNKSQFPYSSVLLILTIFLNSPHHFIIHFESTYLAEDYMCHK